MGCGGVGSVAKRAAERALDVQGLRCGRDAVCWGVPMCGPTGLPRHGAHGTSARQRWRGGDENRRKKGCCS